MLLHIRAKQINQLSKTIIIDKKKKIIIIIIIQTQRCIEECGTVYHTSPIVIFLFISLLPRFSLFLYPSFDSESQTKKRIEERNSKPSSKNGFTNEGKSDDGSWRRWRRRHNAHQPSRQFTIIRRYSLLLFHLVYVIFDLISLGFITYSQF